MIGREGLAQHGYGGVCWAELGSMVHAETGNAGRAHSLVGKPDSIQVLVHPAPEQRLGTAVFKELANSKIELKIRACSKFK